MRQYFLALVTLFILLPALPAYAQFVEYKLTATNGDPNDRFGESVALDGNTAVIGAFRDDDAANDAGAAYVFNFTEDGWQQSQKLTPFRRQGQIVNFANGLFGNAIDIRNNVIVVGAVESRENGTKQGAAYIYEKTGDSTWRSAVRLIAEDGRLNDQFGATVATNGEYVFVGALDHDHTGLKNAGTVYVYERDPNSDDNWILFQKITPADAQAGDSFGWSVSVSGNRLVVGARDVDDQANNAGAIYVYELNNTWQQVDKLYAADANIDDSFGEAVALSGDQIIVGARDVDVKGEESGAAYIFEQLSPGTWTQTAKLLASDGESLDRFGNSVSIQNNVAIVSTRIDNDFSGAFYIFQKTGNSWSETAKVTPENHEAGDLFGQAVDIDGNFIITGTKGDDDEGLDAGAAHIYDLSSTDQHALIALYNATDGPNWIQNTNWLANTPLDTWHGIETNGDGRVISIKLPNNNLSGSLPPAIGSLEYLESLYLGGNAISAPIPSEVSELNQLEILDLSDNNLAPGVPTELFSISGLQTLNLSSNNFTGAIPAGLSQLTNLDVLDLSNNAFAGSVPNTLPSLSTLYLQSNNLADLPELGNSLSEVNVSNNQLTFEDLEPNADINTFIYSPQALVGEARSVTLAENEPLLLQIEVGGDQNAYQWYKNNAAIGDATASSLVVPSVSESDAGTYTVEIMNSLLPALTLISHPIEVNIIPILEFESRLSSLHGIPPLILPATGLLNATLIGNQLSVSGAFSDLTHPFKRAMLHVGAPTVNTAQAFELSATATSGQFVIDEADNIFTLSNEQVIALQNGLFYATIETQTTNISTPVITELRGQLLPTPNAAPIAPTLSSPADGITVDLNTPGTLAINWNNITDPDGNAVHYLWAFSRNPDVSSNIDLVENIVLVEEGTSLTIEHATLDAFLASRGIAQGETVTLHHLVASSDGSLFSRSETASLNLIRSTSNQAPVVDNPINDFVYLLEDGNGTLSLENVFLDPDGDALSLSAESSSPSVATVAISGTNLNITPITSGTSTVTIAAKDPSDREVSDSFELTINSRPQIAVTLQDQALLDNDAPVTQSLSPVFSDADPLTYSTSSSEPGVATAIIENNNVLKITPVAPGITNILVTATDTYDVAVSQTFTLSVQSNTISPPQSLAESINIVFGDATQSVSYKLVALPGDVNIPVGSAVNGVADVDWIAYRDNGQDVSDKEQYFEKFDGSASFTFRPGAGFWLLSKAAWSRAESRPTVPLANDNTYSIPLQSGWNIISNPFDIDVSWTEVATLNNISQQLYRWQNQYVATQVFLSAKTGEAFYYFNNEGLNALKIPYIPNTPGSTSPKLPPALQLTAIANGDTVSVVHAGVHKNAQAGTDVFDQVAPPALFEVASLRILQDASPERTTSGSTTNTPAQNKVGRKGYLNQAFLPDNLPGYRYNITLTQATPTSVTLTASGQNNFENHKEIVLFDSKLGKRYDLRNEPTIKIQPSSSKQAFVLLIGDSDFIATQQAEIVPEKAVLQPNYPNPFARATNIEFALPEPSRLQVVVYDVLGRQVRMLADGDFEAGFHQFLWDGTDNTGVSLASGTYFMQLRLPGKNLTQSIVLRR